MIPRRIESRWHRAASATLRLSRFNGQAGLDLLQSTQRWERRLGPKLSNVELENMRRFSKIALYGSPPMLPPLNVDTGSRINR